MADLISGFPAKPDAGSFTSCEQAIGPAAKAVVGATDATVEINATAPDSAVASVAIALAFIVVLPC
jgi:hypothetical protein